MVLEGVVTNVAAFGAFVDIGVHQDGLVHISAMSKTFIKDPREAAKPGDVVKVKVLEVDAPRKRIALTMRLDDAFDAKASRPAPGGEPPAGAAAGFFQAGAAKPASKPARRARRRATPSPRPSPAPRARRRRKNIAEMTLGKRDLFASPAVLSGHILTSTAAAEGLTWRSK